MYLAQNVEQKYKLEKQKEEKIIIICENNPKSCDYISWNKPKPGEKWNPEDAADVKTTTQKSKKNTRKTTKTKKEKNARKLNKKYKLEWR